MWDLQVLITVYCVCVCVCECFLFQEEFGYNADTQKLLSKNGETLLGAITFFISSVNTLVDKTIEDTIINIKQYETAR